MTKEIIEDLHDFIGDRKTYYDLSRLTKAQKYQLIFKSLIQLDYLPND
jgi:hypothetical protein